MVSKLLRGLGAKVISIGVKPNWFNINEKCGSTYPSKIQSAVKKFKAHVGIAFDGDADRMIAIDSLMSLSHQDLVSLFLSINNYLHS